MPGSKQPEKTTEHEGHEKLSDIVDKKGVTVGTEAIPEDEVLEPDDTAEDEQVYKLDELTDGARRWTSFTCIPKGLRMEGDGPELLDVEFTHNAVDGLLGTLSVRDIIETIFTFDEVTELQVDNGALTTLLITSDAHPKD